MCHQIVFQSLFPSYPMCKFCRDFPEEVLDLASPWSIISKDTDQHESTDALKHIKGSFRPAGKNDIPSAGGCRNVILF